MRRPQGAAFIAVLGLLAILAVSPALAQTSTDTPGGCLHPVVNEFAPGTSATSGVTLWSAVSFAFRQQLALGIWRWMPVTIDPTTVRMPSNALVPRLPWARVGTLSKP